MVASGMVASGLVPGGHLPGGHLPGGHLPGGQWADGQWADGQWADGQWAGGQAPGGHSNTQLCTALQPSGTHKEDFSYPLVSRSRASGPQSQLECTSDLSSHSQTPQLARG